MLLHLSDLSGTSTFTRMTARRLSKIAQVKFLVVEAWWPFLNLSATDFAVEGLSRASAGKRRLPRACMPA
jgi:hypothetical protein